MLSGAGRQAPEGGDRLPAREPVLDLPGRGVRHLPDRRPPAGLGLLLVDPPSPQLALWHCAGGKTMIWLTWRQARTQTLVVAALLAAFGVLLLVSGPHLVSLYRESTLAACHRECAGAAGNFL